MTNNNRIVEAADTALSKVDRKKRVRTAAFYIGALIAGAVLGYIGNATVNSITDVIATVYTRLFSFIAVPVIAVSLMATLSKLTRGGNGGTIFAHTVFYTLLDFGISEEKALSFVAGPSYYAWLFWLLWFLVSVLLSLCFIRVWMTVVAQKEAVRLPGSSIGFFRLSRPMLWRYAVLLRQVQR